MKKILVPTDFSENAFVALEYAQKIASQKGFEVIVLHAFLPFHSGFQSEEANQADRLRFRRELEGEFTMLKDKLSKNQAPTELVTRSVEGNLRQSVNAICDAEEVALIVMGTKGASGMIGQMLGSNTLDIARSAPAPILIVPPQGIPKNIEKVLFLTDYQKQDRNTLSDLVSVFGANEIDIAMTYVYSLPSSDVDKSHPIQQMKDRLSDWANELRSENNIQTLTPLLVQGEERANFIYELAKTQQADVLALTVVTRQFWENITTKSLAKSVILQPHLPIFVGKLNKAE